MSNKVAFSDEAELDLAKLPPNVQRDLEAALNHAVSQPKPPGTPDKVDVVGFAIDGSRFDVEAFLEHREGGLFVESIDFTAY